jgi:hypothetical protein
MQMRSKWIDPRFIAPLIMTVVLALGAVPAAATIETFNIIFTPTSGPALSGSFTVDVTCTSCSITPSSFDITTGPPPAEWTPADALSGGFLAVVDATGVVTGLGGFGMIDGVAPPAIPSNIFLGFNFPSTGDYNISGSNSPAPGNGTYQLAQLAAVPEPVASGLLLAGLAGYGVIARWRGRRISE